jgi:hypothetical protein
MQGQPLLRVAAHENARCVGIDPNKLFADSMGAIDAAEQLLEIVVSDCPLEFCERLPVWRLRQGITEMFRGKRMTAQPEGKKRSAR